MTSHGGRIEVTSSTLRYELYLMVSSETVGAGVTAGTRPAVSARPGWHSYSAHTGVRRPGPSTEARYAPLPPVSLGGLGRSEPNRKILPTVNKTRGRFRVLESTESKTFFRRPGAWSAIDDDSSVYIFPINSREPAKPIQRTNERS